MELDIREQSSEVTSIRVAPVNLSVITADTVAPSGFAQRVLLRDSDSGDSMTIHGEGHAESLIKGLQKAIDLGWFD